MKTSRKQGARRRGFTLIELLVAISVLAVVAVLGWRGLDGIVRSRVALNSQLDQTRGMQLAFAQLQSDCEHLAGAAMLHRRLNLKNEAGALTLVRTVSAENEPTRLQVVTYRVREGVLTRRESNSTRNMAQLDNMWQSALEDSNNNAGVELQTGIDSISVRLWDGKAWAQPGTASVALVSTQPSGLEVGLLLNGHQTGLVKVFLLGAV